MKEFIKKAFCRHRHRKPIQKTQHIEKGKVYMFYGSECKNCKKQWWG